MYELCKNHQGVQRIFASYDNDIGKAVLLGEEEAANYPYLVAAVEAPSWLEAKRLFALPLTEVQTKLASGTITHFELFGRWSGFDLESLKPRSKS